MASTRSAASSTMSPTLACQATISASAVPSRTSGSLKTNRPNSALHDAFEGRADPLLAREVLPFEGVRIGRVPAGDPLDGRLQVIEAGLLHQRRELGAEAGGAPRLMHDHTPASLLHLRGDRLDVH